MDVSTGGHVNNAKGEGVYRADVEKPTPIARTDWMSTFQDLPSHVFTGLSLGNHVQWPDDCGSLFLYLLQRRREWGWR